MRCLPCRNLIEPKEIIFRNFVCGMAVALRIWVGPAIAKDWWMTVPDAPVMPTALTSGPADVNGIKMHYATFGAGDPVLFSHGGLRHSDVAGEYDEAILRRHTDKMAGLIPGAKLLILPRTNHFAMRQAPDNDIAAVRAFID